jgi:hypothetical protein
MMLLFQLLPEMKWSTSAMETRRLIATPAALRIFMTYNALHTFSAALPPA